MHKRRHLFFSVSLLLSLLIIFGGVVAVVTQENGSLSRLGTIKGDGAVFVGILQCGIGIIFAGLSCRKFLGADKRN